MHDQQVRRRSGRGRWAVGLGLALGLAGGLGARTEDVAEGAPVQMSAVTVETRRDEFAKLKIPKEAWDWRSGRMGELTFLTSANDRETERVLQSLGEFRQLLEWMIPQWRRPAARPLRLVLCGARDTFTELRPVASEGYERDAITAYYPAETGAFIVVNLGVNEIAIRETHGMARAGGFSTLNAGYGEEEGASDSFENDSADFPVEASNYLKREYVRDLLASQGWRSPAWFTEGMVQLVATAKIEDGKARIGRLDTVTITSMSDGHASGGGKASELSLFFQGRAMTPLLELFSVGYDSPEYLNAVGSTFSSQALGFVHFCLYGAKGQFQAALLNWVNRLQGQAPSEALFKECFGGGSKAFNTRLRGYFSGGRYASPVTKAEALPEMPAVEIRAAEPAEVAAFKAAVQRAAGRLPAAQTILETAIGRGFTSAEVYDELGAVALAEGDFAAAETAYAQATKLGTETATHRWGVLQTAVLGRATLPAAEVRDLMKSAVQLRTEGVVAPNVITRTMAEIFLRSGLKPDAGFWRLLDDTVGRHPADTALRIAVLRLHAEREQLVEAKALLAAGRAQALPEAERTALDEAAEAVGL